MSKKFKVHFPASGGQNIVEADRSIVVIGANGSGKTRLGMWLDNLSEEKLEVHRIPAHKVVEIPNVSFIQDVQQAQNDLLTGHHGRTAGEIGISTSGRWPGNNPICQLSDCQKVMNYLFSEDAEVSSRYRRQMKELGVYAESPNTKLDYVRELWQKILPHRKLQESGLSIKAVCDEKEYRGGEMSDGERVVFYFVAQCLAAIENSIIVIDEPEIHLHKSIQNKLWDGVEFLRPDCLFIYMTHDLEFAASRAGTTKVWMKSYDGNHWDWEIIKTDEDMPEELLLEILGNRKNVIFAEGTHASWDTKLYCELFEEYLVIPCGSCENVIRNTKAAKANFQLGHIKAYGLVDRDKRVSSQIVNLEKHGIYALAVAEVENLFCVEEIIRYVSKELVRDPDRDFKAVSCKIFEQFRKDKEEQVSRHVISEIQYLLNNIEEATTKKGVKNRLKERINSINVDALYQKKESEFPVSSEPEKYGDLLKLYNRKALHNLVGKELGLSQNQYVSLIIRKSKIDKQIKEKMKWYFGGFPPMNSD